jgi:acyl-coenzyme A thioesterase PaaI-like protein
VSSTASPAIQDLYPDDFSHCYGCGRLNAVGLQIKSRWEGEDVVARFSPRREHIALPGFVYGGLVASLIDCHGIATAAAHAHRAAGREIGDGPTPRYVTAALRVEFRKPTPVGSELVLRARVSDVGTKKIVVAVSLSAGDVETARGEVVAVPMPESMAGGPVAGSGHAAGDR